ncbi:C-C motif chemokine 27a [Pseudochaenichthys georgianus]|uniref:C-C motif chemokine 27a n=1 Tax=Pseudochaenichthys georgianus TaxID=52239 RepID=UPI00146B98A3|nr:C-C motif chemokine 27a [Pseudochaenichthys georgianus]
MDLKVGFAIVCLCALAISSTEAGIPKCCFSVKMDIPLHVLVRVQRWSVQQSRGACDIPALILHIKGLRKPICAHLKLKRALMALQARVKRSRQTA